MTTDVGPTSMTVLYRIITCIVRIGLRVWVHFKSQGGMNVPSCGGCIIASNHVSYLDPPAVACGIRHRMVRFMARDTLFRTRVSNWFFNAVQCVPIDRTKGDVAALRKGIGVLKEGGVLSLFPEGTRSVTGELQQAKGGIGFLIAKAAVPVIPAYVHGSFEAYPKGAKRVKRGHVTVFYGPPIDPSEFLALAQEREYDRIGQLVMARIGALKPANPAA